jgi:hypothetical protein
MIGTRKKFERELYNRFDGPAKEAIKNHLVAQGHDEEVVVPPENFGADLYSVLGGLKFYHEAEVSQGWKEGDHPYPRGSIPERKTRLIHMLEGRPLYFWMLRLDLGRALVFSSVWCKDKYLVEVPNRKVASGEYFYRIPKTHGKEFNLLCL